MGGNYAGQLGDGFGDDGHPFPEQVFPVPQPLLGCAPASPTDLQFDATCEFGGNFRLLGSTDLTLPLSQWTPLQTNSIASRGADNYSVTLTNAVTAGGQQFYILQSP
jgi:hypothetical protein